MADTIDKRNKLNNLTGKEWLKSTKSFWLSEKCKDDKFAFQHPAPFLIKDIEKLIKFFTKEGDTVLDPFSGVATTLISSHNTNRKGIGIDLNKEYFLMAKDRLVKQKINTDQTLICGDSLIEVPKLKTKIDYCVTSPPYHNILKNKGGGLRKENNDYRTGSRNGVEYYSDHQADLGNQNSYDDFLGLFQKVMDKVNEVQRPKKYCSVIISDFTVNKKERCVQGDIIRVMEKVGYQFVGTIVLLQNNKPLYPFGYPFAFVINHHHQNIINFRKI